MVYDLYFFLHLLPLNPKDQPYAQALTDYGGGRGRDYLIIDNVLLFHNLEYKI